MPYIVVAFSTKTAVVVCTIVLVVVETRDVDVTVEKTRVMHGSVQLV